MIRVAACKERAAGWQSSEQKKQSHIEEEIKLLKTKNCRYDASAHHYQREEIVVGKQHVDL